jgi:stage II sporulation protein D
MLTCPLASAPERRKNAWASLCVRLRLARSLGLSLLLVAAVPLVGGSRMGSAEAEVSKGPPIRVLLLEAPLITVGAAGRQGLLVRDQAGEALLQVDPGRQLRVRRVGAALSLESLPRPTSAMALLPANPPIAIEAQALPVPRQLPLQALQVEPIDVQGLMVLKQRRYRGTLLLRPEGDGLLAINRLPLESYLTGVVGSEMPSTWPLAALKAQAVASRTYALQQLRPNAPFDLKATVASQVYKGIEAESAPVRQAVASTRTQVLMHGQQLINAVFHSSSGGSTENSGDLWSRQLPYLVSVPDFDATSPVSQWEQAFSSDALRQAFVEIGGAIAIQPLQASRTGRIRRAKVIGPGGELVLTGSELRQRLGLRSTLVQFHFEPAGRLETQDAPAGPSLFSSPLVRGAEERATAPTDNSQVSNLRLVVRGRGYGHGVGMSQWGAHALALRGKSYEDILRHYYRGAVLRSY